MELNFLTAYRSGGVETLECLLSSQTLGESFVFRLKRLAGVEEEGGGGGNVLVEGTRRLSRLLGSLRTDVENMCDEKIDLSEVALRIKRAVEDRCGFVHDVRGSITSAKQREEIDFMRFILNEIDVMGWRRVLKWDPRSRLIILQVLDGKERVHEVIVHFCDGRQLDDPVVRVCFPGETELRGPFRRPVLQSIQEQCEKRCAQWSVFWDVMEHFDHHAKIMEPLHPSRSDGWRRISLGRGASIRVTICATSPKSLCDCAFMGADSVIAPLRARLDANYRRWDVSKMPLDNLSAILSFEFVPKTKQGNKKPRAEEEIGGNFDAAEAEMKIEDAEEEEDACGICYCVEIDGKVPDVICDGKGCQRSYHSSCLKEWFQSSRDTMRSFDVLFGECPYCTHPISVRMTSEKR